MPGARSPIRQPPARCRCSTRTANAPPRCIYTAYVAKGIDAGRRPLTFAFNGGPGAASVYLNLGIAGPRIVDFSAERPDGATAKLIDNPDTWLAFTDLVMIDPIGTGWSRTAKADGGSAYWGVRSDASVLAKVIALYVAKKQPRRVAEISAGRKLRRIPRRQGRGHAARANRASWSAAS